ncbi:MAG: phage minor head protein [Chitinispirillia bacterium]|nr:phage minor head protein [Chitinispirillia bacterium]
MDSQILIDAFKLKPAQAIKFMQSKGYAISWNWFDTWKEAHAKAFTVAKCMQLDVLKDIRAMVDKALKEGITLQQFKKELKPQLEKKGWWGKKELVNEETGEVTEYVAGSPMRLETIYRTNLQTSYMAGRYEGQMASVDDLPIWQYLSVIDGKTTDRCREMHERAFYANDPIWDTMYPPNHWGCRARVRALSETMAQRYGAAVESSKGRIVTKEVTVGKGEAARTETVTGLKLPNGQTFWTGPGWDYNPGKEMWAPNLEQYAESDARTFVTSSFNGPAYKMFVDAKGSIGGSIPVAVLPDKYMKVIGAKTNIVELSSATLKKNTAHHPEILTDDYLNLQTIIEKAQTIVQDGKNTMVFIEMGDKFYHAAIKTTRTGKGLFMTSLRRTYKKEIERMKRVGKVIKG